MSIMGKIFTFKSRFLLVFFLMCLLLNQSDVVAQLLVNQDVSLNKQNFVSNESEILFTENKGQVHDGNYVPREDVLFISNGKEYKYIISKTGVSHQLSKPIYKKDVDDEMSRLQRVDSTRYFRVDMNWVGASTNFGVEKNKAHSSFMNYANLPYVSSPITGVKKYEEVRLKNVYKGIDVRYYSNNGELEYDYEVYPGADYRKIQIEIKGADAVLNDKGELEITTDLGVILESAPIVFQNGVQLPSKWKQNKNKTWSFEVENYNPNKKMIIDPVVRLWGTYYGEIDEDYGRSSATDGNGNVYFVGETRSEANIATVGAHQTTVGGNLDAFIVKFDSLGVRQWGTYYGGTAADMAYAVAVDATNNIYVVGQTNSTTAISAGAGIHQAVKSTGIDAFILRLDEDGNRDWCTYFGGNSSDYGYGVDVFGANLYIAGRTLSSTGIATAGAHQTTYQGNDDAFLSRFNTTDGSRVWATYYGGLVVDHGYTCAVDSQGDVYLAGRTTSLSGIASAGAHQIANGGGADGFLVKFNANGSRQWGTFFGGTEIDFIRSCAVDQDDNVFVVGQTGSPASIATAGAFDDVYNGAIDGFLAKFNGSGARQWGTYIGNTNTDDAFGVAIDANNGVYVVGETQSDTDVSTVGVHQEAFGGFIDAYLMKFDDISGAQLWSTYYGGTDLDQFNSVALFDIGFIYAGGFTESNNAIYENGHQANYEGGSDAMLVKFFDCSTQDIIITGPAETCPGSVENYTVNVVPSPVNPWVTSDPSIATIDNTGELTAVSDGVVTIIFTSIYGCTEEFELTVNPLPVISGDFTVCLNEDSQLVADNDPNADINIVWVSSNPAVATITTGGLVESVSAGTTTITYTDINGCTDDILFRVNALPVISGMFEICIGTTTQLTANIAPALVDPWLSSDDLIASVNTTGLVSANDFGDIEIVYTDVNGCRDTVDFSVADTEDPTFDNCPGNIIGVSNDNGVCGAQVSWVVPVASDNCGVTNETASHLPNQLFSVGTTLVSYFAEDAFGNNVTCSFSIEVIDDEDPVITCPLDITVDTDPGECTAIVNYLVPISDNCPDPTLSQLQGFPSGDPFPIGITINEFEVVDGSGNSATCSFTITVEDNEDPTITCPADITMDNDPTLCEALVSYNVMIADNCPFTTVLQPAGIASDEMFPLGTTLNTFVVEDAAGNTATCSFNVTIVDTEDPTITCPADIVVGNDLGECSAIVNYLVEFDDNCPGSDLSQTLGLASGSQFPFGVTSNTFVVEDAAGNTATCSFDVTVNDTENPTIVCPADTTINNDLGLCEAAFTYNVTFADNCPGSDLFQTLGLASGSQFPVGVTTNTFVVEDAVGNTETCSFNVTVVDNEDPTITCPGNITINSDPALCSAVVAIAIPVTDDNCGVLSVVNDFNGLEDASDTYPVGNNVVEYTVTDVNTNTNTCSFTVNVIDNENPTITCPDPIVQISDLGVCEAVVNVPLPITADNCGIATVVNNYNSTNNATDIYPVGVTNVNYIVTDLSGNTASCSFSITITDDEDPTIVCPPVTQTADAGLCSAVVTIDVPVTDDNCAVLSFSNDFTGTTNASGTYPVGVTVVTYVIADVNGNTSGCTFDVTVTDDELPTITCPNNISQNADGGVCEAVVNVPLPTTDDNCTVASTVNDYNLGANATDIYPVGVTTVTYTVTDVNNNSDVCSFDITVIDTQNPVITCPDDINQTADAGLCEAAVAIGIPVTTDNCGVLSVENDFNLTNDASDTYPVGTSTVTYVVTDISTNTATCSFNVIITDNEDPTITCPGDINETAEAGICTATLVILEPVTADNCGVASVVNDFNLTSDASDTYPVGTTTITYLVTDLSGNTETCSFDIVITDDEDPTIDCSDVTQTADPGVCEAVVTIPVPVTADNCAVLSFSNDFTGTTNASATYPVGTTTVTYVIADVNGNTSGCTFEVTVTDDESPIFVNCPASTTIILELGDCDSEHAWVEPTLVDNCDNNPTITPDPVYFSGYLFPTGSTEVVYVGEDMYGNTTTCEFTVLVIDINIPTVSDCPVDQNLNTEPGLCGAVATWEDPIAEDLCSTTLLLESDYETGETFPVGSTLVTYTVTDISGNVNADCSFTITVVDVEFPVISNMPADTLYFCAGEEVVWDDIAVSDNCDVTLSTSVNSGDNFETGFTTVVVTAVDNSGNTTTDDFVVRVYPNPNVTLSESNFDVCIANDFSVRVIAPSTTESYAWYFGNTLVSQVSSFGIESVVIENAGVYRLITTNIESGCTTENQFILTVELCAIEIPEGFSPNDDGINDLFVIKNIEAYPNTVVEIYTRWGAKVYESSSYDNTWDGRSINDLNYKGDELPEGTYFYTIKLGGNASDATYGARVTGYIYIKR
jgi:large repetitive protein